MSSTVKDELKDVQSRLKNIVPNTEIIGCHQANVQIKITRTKHKQCVCQFQFPPNYPSEGILLELKSKVYPIKVLDAMLKLTEAEIKKLVGRQQIISVIKFVNNFMAENPLIVCSEEISQIRKKIVQEQDDFKVKQKAGTINYKIISKRYFLHVKLTIPDNYPVECVIIEFKGSNFPLILESHFVAQANEIARQCTQPPLRKDPKAPPWQVKHSLFPVLEYLAYHCVHKFPIETCPCCKKPALADDPEKCQSNPNADDFVEWVYCKHIYHHSCLDIYMKTPPFTGGKKCPKCGSRIYHEKWNISPELAEERWAHKEARKREIEEVTDFLDLM